MQVDWYVSREEVSDLIFDKMELRDPVEVLGFGYDEVGDQFCFLVDVSGKDAIKFELAGAEIEA